MASQPNSLDPLQLQSLVSWLEEQRKQDRQELSRLTAEVERLVETYREQGAHISELRGALDEARGAIGRLTTVDEGLRSTREHVGQLVERLDTFAQQTSHALLLRAADSERDRKQTVEQAQAIARLEHAQQSYGARVITLADEIRKERDQAGGVPKLLSEMEERTVALTRRVDRDEELLRRIEALMASEREELETIRAEQGRTLQWRQLADLRWTRQVAEWQQTIDNWRQAADEHARPVQHTIAQIGQLRDELRTTQSAANDHQRRLDDNAAGVARLESQLSQQREAVGRLEQATDAQRRRFDEQSSAQLRLDEGMGRAVEEGHAVARTLDEQSRQIDEIRTACRLVEANAARMRDELEHARGSLGSHLDEARELFGHNVQRLDQASQELDVRMQDFKRLTQEHRQRLALELEQQAREVGEQLNRLRAS